MATFAHYSGTAEQYIREYLDPSGTLNDSPTTEDEARSLWADLEENYASEGGTGIDEEEFVEAVERMQFAVIADHGDSGETRRPEPEETGPQTDLKGMAGWLRAAGVVDPERLGATEPGS